MHTVLALALTKSFICEKLFVEFQCYAFGVLDWWTDRFPIAVRIGDRNLTGQIKKSLKRSRGDFGELNREHVPFLDYMDIVKLDSPDRVLLFQVGAADLQCD